MRKDSRIYHMCPAEDWRAARAAGGYRGGPQDEADGFIHFSRQAQIRESARKHRKGEAGLVLLEVDAEILGGALKWETSRGGALFPHLYGPLPLDAVLAVHDLALGPDGLHIFPASI